MKPTNNDSNIDNSIPKILLNFSIDADDYLEMAMEHMKKSDLESAILFLNNAFQVGKDKCKALGLMMEVYFRKKDYRLAYESACELLSTYKLDADSRARASEILVYSLIKLGKSMAGLFYMAGPGKDIRISQFQQSTEKALENAYSELPDIFNLPKERIKFADQQRLDYNFATFQRAFDLYKNHESAQALRLIESMYETDFEFANREILRGHCLIDLGRYEEAFDVLADVFDKDPRRGDVLFKMCDLVDQYRPELVKMAESLVVCEDPKNEDGAFLLENAVYSASVLELDDLARKWTEILCKMEPNNYKYQMLKAFAMWNVGEKEQAKDLLFGALYKMRWRYPVEYIEKLRFPKRIPIEDRAFPEVLCKKLEILLKKELSNFDERLKDSDFVEALVFLLIQDDYTLDTKTSNAIESSDSPELIKIAKRVCAYPCKPQDHQRWLVGEVLLQKSPKGTILFNKNNYISKVKLRVPKSYDDYVPDLQDSYRQSFAFLCDTDESFLSKLDEVFETMHEEKLYKLFPSTIPLSHIVTYAFLSKFLPDELNNFCIYYGVRVPVVKEIADGFFMLMGEDYGDDDDED